MRTKLIALSPQIFISITLLDKGLLKIELNKNVGGK